MSDKDKIKLPDKYVRPTNIELHRRVAIIADLVCLNMTDLEIIDHCLTEYAHWMVRVQTLRKYIRQAKEMLLKAADSNRRAFFAESVAQLDMIFRKCAQSSDWSGALDARKEKNRLLGLKDVDPAYLTGASGAVDRTPKPVTEADKDAVEAEMAEIMSEIDDLTI